MLWPVSDTPAEEKARARSVSPGLMTTYMSRPCECIWGFCLWSLGGVLFSLSLSFLSSP